MKWQDGRKFDQQLMKDIYEFSDVLASFGLPYDKLRTIFQLETDNVQRSAYALTISGRDEFLMERDHLLVDQVMDAIPLERWLYLAGTVNPLVRAVAYDYIASSLPNGKINIRKEIEPYQKIPKRRRKLG